MSCTCQECGNQYTVDVVVPDDVWNAIRPSGKPEGGGMLCGSCIFARIEAAELQYASYEVVRTG